jgi:pimeloyl-ACP methyl ester carboxylesterase
VALNPYVCPDSFTEDSVNVDGFAVRYVTGGEGDPLVYIHGGGGPDWGPAIQRLADHFHVVAIEMPGFGESADNNRTLDAADMARTMVGTLEAAGLERYGVLGCSIGGAVSLWLATEVPDRVTHLVLEAPAALRVTDDLDLFSMPEPEAILKMFHAQPHRKPWLEEGVVPPLRNPELVARIRGPKMDEALVDRLRTLQVPTLVMFGTEDGVMSPDQGRVYKQILPECVFTLVYDAAHDLKGDRPEAFVDLVVDFVGEGSFLVNHRSSVINP